MAGTPSPPITFGARNHTKRSTSPARNRPAMMRPPPSTISRVIPASPSAESAAPRSRFPCPSGGTSINRTPASSKALRRAASPSALVRSQVGVAPAVATRAWVSGRSLRPSTTTRTGDSASSPGRRQVSDGSSTIAVRAPTRMASCRARMPWPRALDSGPVIHSLSPDAVAMRPSRVVAVLTVTIGRPCRTRVRKPAATVSAAAGQIPSATSIPASASIDMPPPSTRGSGSRTPITTRAMPASISARAQGGVWP